MKNIQRKPYYTSNIYKKEDNFFLYKEKEVSLFAVCGRRVICELSRKLEEVRGVRKGIDQRVVREEALKFIRDNSKKKINFCIKKTEKKE